MTGLDHDRSGLGPVLTRTGLDPDRPGPGPELNLAPTEPKPDQSRTQTWSIGPIFHNFRTRSKNQKCGKSYNFRYDDEQDELSSPGFAGRNTSYENNVDCEWIIQTGPKLTFKFQMVVFELESGPPDCEFDYLSFETKDKGKFSRGFWFRTSHLRRRAN